MISKSQVDLHGAEIVYRHGGDGPETLLLVHGIAGSSRVWRQVMPELARTYRVIAPDLPGHGLSSKGRGDYSLGAFAAVLRDLLQELDVDRVTVVGHSLGGGVALQLAYQHPELVGRIALISSGGLGPEVGWPLRLLAAPGAELVLPVIAPPFLRPLGDKIREWVGGKGVRADNLEEMWLAYASLSDSETRKAFLRTLRSVVDTRGQAVSASSRLHLANAIPSQLIWGDADPMIPVAHGLGAHEAMPGSRLRVLPGVGHFPQTERPEEVEQILTEFISQTRMVELPPRSALGAG
ncbi:alpha/beta fold hydrolase [Tomitella biformata]|uniref:alpha/beta fold hydrolase n=1 Tax=Tomitella biformata TaxID=630403 RepID=UPI000464CBF9